MLIIFHFSHSLTWKEKPYVVSSLLNCETCVVVFLMLHVLYCYLANKKIHILHEKHFKLFDFLFAKFFKGNQIEKHICFSNFYSGFFCCCNLFEIKTFSIRSEMALSYLMILCYVFFSIKLKQCASQMNEWIKYNCFNHNTTIMLQLKFIAAQLKVSFDF